MANSLKKQLYYRMLLLRRSEERIVSNYHLREMRSPPHMYMGHEAVAVGVCATLKKEDLIFPYYRSHGWYLAKGGDLNEMMAELHGRETGCSRGWGGSMHLIHLESGVMGTSAIVAGTISHAAGAALALRMKRKKSIAVSIFGDGATEEGAFHETLNFAALYKLPMIFVCENNIYATNTHIKDRQAQTKIYARAESYGMPGTLVDGNDVLKVYAAAKKAVERARRGIGPTLIEFTTYRYLEHCGINPDIELGYRTAKEVKKWMAGGPLEKAKRYVTEGDRAKMDKEISDKLDEAFAYAKASPFPTSLFPTPVERGRR